MKEQEVAFTLIEEVGDVRSIKQFKSINDYAEYLNVCNEAQPDFKESQPKLGDAASNLIMESGCWYMCNLGSETKPILHHCNGYWSFDRNSDAAGMIENIIPLYKMVRA